MLGSALSQIQCRVGWSPRISRTPPGFELSAPFAFSDTTGSAVCTFPKAVPSIYSSARRRVSANFDNTSKIRAFGSVRIFGDDAKGAEFWHRTTMEPEQKPTAPDGSPVLCQNAALLKKTTNQQLRRPWNPRRIQGISRRRADFRPMG